jgi:FkbH-like protein
MVLEAFRHQEVPVAEVFRSMRTDRSGTFDPFFNVMITLFVQPAVAEAGGLQITPLDVWLPHGTLYYDLFLGWVQIGKRLYLLVDYAEDLFGIDTIRVLFDAYRDLLEACTRDTDARLSTLPISALLRAKAQASEEPPLTLTVAATFTAEPVEASLQFWSDELGCSWRLMFSPYNQVFQQLLEAGSDLSRNPNGINVLLVRLADLIASGDSDGLDSEIAQLVRAVSASRAPVLLLLCPSSPEDGGWAAHENGLSTTLRDTPGVHVMIPAEIDALYAVTDAHDPYADALGHIPYRFEYYAVLGTLIARHVHAAMSKPRKVIAVDCDNTLWGGVCAEVGPEGVELEAGHLALQEFLVAQHDQGMLLCLCSKNEGADVRAVFDQRPEMPLRLEQIASSRIDWQPKSGNLRSLARQLNVGLESFVFIDDNPLECAEVRANCPEVVVLPVPEDAGRVPDVLRHLWALDRLAITHEDRQRTAFYRCEADREQFRHQAPSLAEFLERLDLRIEISEMVASQVARVAQLTQRTNQFNTTSWRLSEAELADLCNHGGRRCLVTSVRDRFGDHGLVGAAIFADDGDALRVEGFLQSCRTLGRGVEHRMLSALGERAHSAGKRWVDLPVVATARNRPVREFLEGIGGSHADGGVVRFDAATAAVVRFDPHGQERLTEVTGSDPAGLPEEDSRAEVDTDPETLVRIAYELSRPGDIFAAVSRHHQERTGRKPGDPSTFVAPRNPDEEALTRLWADLLGVEQVGIHDDFFALGGDSIVAIQMTGRARTAGLSLTPADLLTHKTVASLVALGRG